MNDPTIAATAKNQNADPKRLPVDAAVEIREEEVEVHVLPPESCHMRGRDGTSVDQNWPLGYSLNRQARSCD